MRTLLLDLDTWDLCLDKAGQIALANGAYGIAQDVANATRLFTDDAWYDPERGIPHFAIELGHKPSISVLRNRIRQAALTVEGVVDADVKIEGVTDRNLTGSIDLTLTTGEEASVAL